MSLRLLLLSVVTAIGRDVAHAVLLAKSKQRLIHYLLFLQAMPIELRIKMFSKCLLPPDKSLFGLHLSDVQNQGRNLAKQTACRGDQVTFECGDELLVNSWTVVKTVGIGLGTELGKVLVTGLVSSK